MDMIANLAIIAASASVGGGIAYIILRHLNGGHF